MHSGSLERSGTPRKRTLSRGMSEDESLRHIIKEAEGLSKRLTRSDSRHGSLKRSERAENQCEEDLLMGLPEMTDLQANYDDKLQELRGVELQREALLFQVDCLQDALEGAEEMLAETQREAHDASMELAREREARRKLEDMVGSLMQEVKRLKEERNTIPAVPVYTLVRSMAQEEEATTEERDKPDGKEKQATTNKEVDVSKGEPFSLVRLNSVPATQAQSPRATEARVEGSTGGLLSSFFKMGKDEQSPERLAGPAWLQGAPQGTSVDAEVEESAGTGENGGSEVGPSGNQLSRIQRLVNKTFGLSEPEMGHTGRDLSPDRDDNDESSGYEDAASELQDQDAFPDSSTPDGPPEEGFPEEEGGREEDGGTPTQKNANEPRSPKSPNDSCILS